MCPAIETLLLHIFLAVGWSFPARRLMPTGMHPAGSLGLGYVFGATVLLLLHHGLELFALHSSIAVWAGWGLSWFFSMRILPPPSPWRRAATKEMVGVIVLTLMGLGLRLYDPLCHASLPAFDSYVILKHTHRYVVDGILYHEYIAGLPVLMGSLRFTAHSMDVLRFAPPVIASLSIPAFFALGYSLYGRNVAWISAILLAGGFGFLHIASFYIVFIQFTTLALGLPYLLLFMPRAIQNGGYRDWAITACIWIFLTLTGTYFALILAAATCAWLVLCRATKSISTPTFLKSFLLIILLVPAWIGFHYAVAIPLRNKESKTTFTSQVRDFKQLEEHVSEDSSPPRQTSVVQGPLAPVITGFQLFVLPKRLDWMRPSLPETLAMWGLALLSVPLLSAPVSSSGFIGAIMLFSLGCTVTGMFEMPGYQGRYLFLFLLLGLLVATRFLACRLAPRILRWARVHGSATRHFFRRKALYIFAGTLCLPSFISPPEAGTSLPTASDIIVRDIPEDDVITRLLLHRPWRAKRYMLYLHRNKDEDLRGSQTIALGHRENILHMKSYSLVMGDIMKLFHILCQGVPSIYVMSAETWHASGFEQRRADLASVGIQVIHASDDTVVLASRTLLQPR